MTDHYETLDVPRDASPEAIKKTYRKKAKKTHPDKGGDKAEFTALALAYETLSDAEKRERYDRTGKDGKITDIEREARNLLCKEFASLLDAMKTRIFDVDPFEKMVSSIDRSRRAKHKKITRVERDIVHFEKVKTRIRRRSETAPPMFELMIENLVRAAQEQIVYSKLNLQILDKANEILADFEWERDVVIVRTIPTTGAMPEFLYG